MTAALAHAPPCHPCGGTGWLPSGPCPRCVETGRDARGVAPDHDPRGLHAYAVERVAGRCIRVLARLHHLRAESDGWAIARAIDAHPDARREPVRLVRAVTGLGEADARRVVAETVEALREHARVMRSDPRRWARETEDTARAVERVAEEMAA